MILMNFDDKQESYKSVYVLQSIMSEDELQINSVAVGMSRNEFKSELNPIDVRHGLLQEKTVLNLNVKQTLSAELFRNPSEDMNSIS